MEKLLKKLNIDETFTKRRNDKQKDFNHFKNNIPLIEDYNFMADLLELPETKNNNKYLLSVVDLATDEFDIEPLKNKTPKDVLDGFKEIFKRKYLKKPYGSIRTDNGNEFKGIFNKWMEDENIFHKVNLPNRHTQMANVEALNKQLGRLFNGYMNQKEEATGKVYKNWDDITELVRKELNKLRKKKLKPYNLDDYPIVNIETQPKFKVGDVVHYKLDWAESALGHKQPTPNFRVGDYRYSRIPKKIIKVIYMNDKPYYRYLLEGIPNASFSEYQLIQSKEKETKYKVKTIIGKRVNKKITEYLIWWDGYKKDESTWEPEQQLIKDGLKDIIDKYNKH